MITATKFQDISCAHRIVDHEGKCKYIHGHNYRIHFTCTADKLDDLGMVSDFAVIQKKLCDWVEEHWDHKFLIWDQDPMIDAVSMLIEKSELTLENRDLLVDTCAILPFNTTAENLADHLLKVVGPKVLDEGTKLVSVVVEETRKCFAQAE